RRGEDGGTQRGCRDHHQGQSRPYRTSALLSLLPTHAFLLSPGSGSLEAAANEVVMAGGRPAPALAGHAVCPPLRPERGAVPWLVVRAGTSLPRWRSEPISRTCHSRLIVELIIRRWSEVGGVPTKG